MSEQANFANICLQGMRDRNMRSVTELGWEIQGNCFLWFRPHHHWCNLFHFSQRESRFSIVQITHQLKFFTLRFLLRRKVEKKFVLTNKIVFVSSIQFVACVLWENLSNRASGVVKLISCDICTRFECYLYSTKCSWIIITMNKVIVQILISEERDEVLRTECYLSKNRKNSITSKRESFYLQ